MKASRLRYAALLALLGVAVATNNSGINNRGNNIRNNDNSGVTGDEDDCPDDSEFE